MQTNKQESIIVDNVYKTFNVYLDKANTIKEKLMFFKRNKKECRYKRFKSIRELY